MENADILSDIEILTRRNLEQADAGLESRLAELRQHRVEAW